MIRTRFEQALSPELNSVALDHGRVEQQVPVMTYDETTQYPRRRDVNQFPVVAHIEIDAEDWAEFQRLAEDQTQIKVVGHDLANDDRIVAHVACTNDQARERLESRWA